MFFIMQCVTQILLQLIKQFRFHLNNSMDRVLLQELVVFFT